MLRQAKILPSFLEPSVGWIPSQHGPHAKTRAFIIHELYEVLKYVCIFFKVRRTWLNYVAFLQSLLWGERTPNCCPHSPGFDFSEVLGRGALLWELRQGSWYWDLMRAGGAMNPSFPFSHQTWLFFLCFQPLLFWVPTWPSPGPQEDWVGGGGMRRKGHCAKGEVKKMRKGGERYTWAVCPSVLLRLWSTLSAQSSYSVFVLLQSWSQHLQNYLTGRWVTQLRNQKPWIPSPASPTLVRAWRHNGEGEGRDSWITHSGLFSSPPNQPLETRHFWVPSSPNFVAYAGNLPFCSQLGKPACATSHTLSDVKGSTTLPEAPSSVTIEQPGYSKMAEAGTGHPVQAEGKTQ